MNLFGLIITLIALTFLILQVVHYAAKANNKYDAPARIKAPPRPAKFRQPWYWNKMSPRKKLTYYATYADQPVTTYAPNWALTHEDCRYCRTQ